MIIQRYRYLIWAMVAAIAVAFGLAWGIAATKRDFFPYNIVKMVWGDAGLDAHVRSARRDLMEIQDKYGRPNSTVIVGDSIMAAVPWHEILPDVTVRAVGGATSADVLARLPKLSTLPSKRSVLMIGVNDVLAGEAPEAIADRVEQIVTGLPGRVTLMGVWPCNSKFPRCASYLPTIAALNSKLAAKVGERVTYVPPPPSVAEHLTYDGLHLRLAGMEMLVEHVLRTL